MQRFLGIALLVPLLASVATSRGSADDIELNAQPLELIPDDPAAAMVAGIDRFLLAKLRQASAAREAHWRDATQLTANRRYLVERLGMEPKRHEVTDGPLYESPAAIGKQSYVAYVRWPVLSHPAKQTAALATLWGEGWFIGHHQRDRPLFILVPDADESPEDYLILEPSNDQQRFIARVAESMNVLVVSTVAREVPAGIRVQTSRREYLHRSAFELGRTLTGYEVQMVQSAIDHWQPSGKVTVCGIGEGGLTALLAGAIDQRVDVTMVGAFFEDRQAIWQQPLSRQIFGLLNRFSDAEIASLVAPRAFIEFAGPQIEVEQNGRGAAPAGWSSPDADARAAEFQRFRGITRRLFPEYENAWSVGGHLEATEEALASALGFSIPPKFTEELVWTTNRDELLRAHPDRDERMTAMIDSHNQLLLAESDYERGRFMNLGYSRTIEDNADNMLMFMTPDAYEASVERYRTIFREEVIGWFGDERMPVNARTRPAHTGDGWTAHAVFLDVFPDVFAYGQLLVPDGIKNNERRPVVVCQHGLEGRPEDTFLGNHRAYHDFAAKLAQRGFLVFAPQNPYIGGDAFRTLQRKSYPIGKTLFSTIGAQHEQILTWLKSLPNVDPDRIAFYGLSYGGKSAMRLPALLPDYCLSICSADFNDWVWKNASSRSRYSYIGTGEYEIFEFGLGKRFNYAEMAALICPRPFMVERGHFDGVAPDDRVAKEFAKVRHLYQAQLKLKGRCEIEWFDGPHTINGKGTFEFLHRHLDWPEK